MIRLMALLVGTFLILFGVVGILTPIPFGFIFLVAGLLIVIPASPGAARAVRQARKRSRLFDKLLYRITGNAAFPYRRVLRQTEVHDLDRPPY